MMNEVGWNMRERDEADDDRKKSSTVNDAPDGNRDDVLFEPYLHNSNNGHDGVSKEAPIRFFKGVQETDTDYEPSECNYSDDDNWNRRGRNRCGHNGRRKRCGGAQGQQTRQTRQTKEKRVQDSSKQSRKSKRATMKPQQERKVPNLSPQPQQRMTPNIRNLRIQKQTDDLQDGWKECRATTKKRKQETQQPLQEDKKAQKESYHDHRVEKRTRRLGRSSPWTRRQQEQRSSLKTTTDGHCSAMDVAKLPARRLPAVHRTPPSPVSKKNNNNATSHGDLVLDVEFPSPIRMRFQPHNANLPNRNEAKVKQEEPTTKPPCNGGVRPGDSGDDERMRGRNLAAAAPSLSKDEILCIKLGKLDALDRWEQNFSSQNMTIGERIRLWKRLTTTMQQVFDDLFAPIQVLDEVVVVDAARRGTATVQKASDNESDATTISGVKRQDETSTKRLHRPNETNLELLRVNGWAMVGEMGLKSDDDVSATTGKLEYPKAKDHFLNGQPQGHEVPCVACKAVPECNNDAGPLSTARMGTARKAVATTTAGTMTPLKGSPSCKATMGKAELAVAPTTETTSAPLKQTTIDTGSLAVASTTASQLKEAEMSKEGPEVAPEVAPPPPTTTMMPLNETRRGAIGKVLAPQTNLTRATPIVKTGFAVSPTTTPLSLNETTTGASCQGIAPPTTTTFGLGVARTTSTTTMTTTTETTTTTTMTTATDLNPEDCSESNICSSGQSPWSSIRFSIPAFSERTQLPFSSLIRESGRILQMITMVQFMQERYKRRHGGA